jgi:hypothetical protein
MIRHRPVAAVALLLAGAALLHLPRLHDSYQNVASAQGQTPDARKDLPDEKAIRALIAQLGDDSFEKRETAQKRLAVIGLPALELVRKAAKEAADQETRERAAQLVREIGELRYRPALKDQHWGDSVDPDGDCKFLLEFGKLHIKIPGKPHRLAVELGPNTAPRVLRQMQGDFLFEVKILAGSPSVRRSETGSSPWHGAGVLIWQDENNYLRLERARQYVSGDNWRCYANWKLRQGGKLTRQAAGAELNLEEGKPVYFKLNRKADTFTATYSQDGKTSKELPPIRADFAIKLGVGICASHNTGVGYDAVFEDLKLVP